MNRDRAGRVTWVKWKLLFYLCGTYEAAMFHCSDDVYTFHENQAQNGGIETGNVGWVHLKKISVRTYPKLWQVPSKSLNSCFDINTLSYVYLFRNHVETQTSSHICSRYLTPRWGCIRFNSVHTNLESHASETH